MTLWRHPAPAPIRNAHPEDAETLRLYYRCNVLSGRLPVAGYFCLTCGHEMVDPRSHVCEVLEVYPDSSEKD